MRLFFMKFISCLILLLTVSSLYAQLGLELESNNKNYIQYEPVFLRLTMTNYSGYALPFTDTGTILTTYTFEVEDHTGHLVPFNDKRMLPFGSFVLNQNSKREVIIPITRYVDVRKPGTYRVKIIVAHPFMPDKYESNWIPFSVVRGSKVWSRKVGAAAPTVYTGSKIPVRDVSLSATYDGNRKVYYFIIEDERQIHALYRLGQEFDAARPPICEMGNKNDIHISMNVSQRLYAYFVFDIDGQRKTREAYACLGGATPPYFVRDKTTRELKRVGGRLAKKDEYYDYGDEFAATPILSTREY